MQIKKHKKNSNAIVSVLDDPIFKEVFTCPECREYTCKLLSKLTGMKYETLLNNLVVENNELSKSNKNERGKSTDVLLSVEGHKINLEMNKSYYPGLFERNDFFLYNLLSRLPVIGESYKDYKSVVQINFDITNPFKKIISEFRVMEIDNHEIENETYKKIHINLSKIRDLYYDKDKKSEEELKNLDKEIEKLLAFLVVSNKEELDTISKGDETLMKAKDKLEKLSEEDAYKELLSDEWAEKMQEIEDYYLEKYYSEKSFKDGKQEGETNKAKETAKKMLKDNLDIEIIAKYTGLKKEEIEKLK